MTRDKQGEIHLLLNRCTHRANLVCDAPKGNSSAFRCPYHGWTFSNTGKLLGYPFNSGYGGARAQEGARPRPRCRASTSYHGLRLRLVRRGRARRSPSTSGAAADAFDRLVRLSPDRRGRADRRLAASTRSRPTGRCCSRTRPTATTRSSCTPRSSASPSSGIGDLYGEKSTAVSRDLGNGHTENDLRPEFRRIGQPLGWFGTDPSEGARLRRRRWRPPTATTAARDPDRRLAARDGLPEPVHRRDPAVRAPAARRRRDGAARDRRSSSRARRT